MADEQAGTTDQGGSQTAESGKTVPADGLTDQAKSIISGLSKSDSKKFEVIKAFAEEMGLDPHSLTAEQAKAIAAKAKAGGSSDAPTTKVPKSERLAALAEFIGDEKYSDVLPTLKFLAENDVMPSKALADTLLSSATPNSSGPRTTGGSSGKQTTPSEDIAALEQQMKDHNIFGERIR